MKIVFFGVGALGSHAATLCRSLAHELRFVDFDRVETKNLLAQAFVKASLGRNKAEALRLQFLNFHGVETEAFPVRVGSTNVEALASGAGLMVDCLDNLRGRTVLMAHARSHGVPLVHAAISADGTFGLIRWDERFQPDEEDEEGGATCEGGEHLPFIGLVAGALAGVIRDFVDSDVRRDLMITPGGIAAT